MDTLRSWVKWTESECQRFLKLSNSKNVSLLKIRSTPVAFVRYVLQWTTKRYRTKSLSFNRNSFWGGSQCVQFDANCRIFPPFSSTIYLVMMRITYVKYLKLKDNQNLSTVSRTDETFISFSVEVPIRSYINKCGVGRIVQNAIRFLGSFNFMASALDSLAQTLQVDDLKLLRHHFQSYFNSDFRKIRSKGLFPYSYLTVSKSLMKLVCPLSVTNSSWGYFV